MIIILPFPADAAVSGVRGESANQCVTAAASRAGTAGTLAHASATEGSLAACLATLAAVEWISVHERTIPCATSGRLVERALIVA